MFSVTKGLRPCKPSLEKDFEGASLIWDVIEACWTQSPKQRPTASDVVQRIRFPGRDMRKSESTITLLPANVPLSAKQSPKFKWTLFTAQQRTQKRLSWRSTSPVSTNRGLSNSMCIQAPGKDIPAVFGSPLRKSLEYANIQICSSGSNGELCLWGYIPAVVARWYVCH